MRPHTARVLARDVWEGWKEAGCGWKFHFPFHPLGAELLVRAREEKEAKGRYLFIYLDRDVAFWDICLLVYLIFYGFDVDSGRSNMSVDKGLVPKQQPCVLKIS